LELQEKNLNWKTLDMPEPINNPTDYSIEETDAGPVSNLQEKIKTPITRRKFLQLALIAAGAGLLTACDPQEVLSSEEPNLEENINELNKQFEEVESKYLDEAGNFNYEPFKTNPEFERYITEIHTNSERFGRELNINPNALKLLSSAIISASLGEWEKVNPNQPPYAVRDRVGPMRFYPSTALETIKRKLKDNYNYTLQEIEGTFNIQIGLNHLVYGCLPNIDKSGENTNYIQLTLAHYIGGKDLVTHIKNNKEVAEGSFLRESYDLYIKTASVINPEHPVGHVEKSGVESNLEQIWNTATKEFWTDSNLEIAKNHFLEQAAIYSTEDYKRVLGLSEEETLALFISISMTESYGGANRGPNEISGARGWFQVIPDQHLWQYNERARTLGEPEYDIHQLLDDPKASTAVGYWAFMRYAFSENFLSGIKREEDFANVKALMRFFKAGGHFDTHWESGIWWNRVSYCMGRLLGRDALNLGYIDYQYPPGVVNSGRNFEGSGHAGAVIIEPEREKAES
jgi:hypothetical protein